MKWYFGNSGTDQGLIIDEGTGENIAVSYNKENAPLISAAPDLLEATIKLKQCFKQHNYLSTATEQEKNLFISNVIDVWNNHFRQIYEEVTK